MLMIFFSIQGFCMVGDTSSTMYTFRKRKRGGKGEASDGREWVSAIGVEQMGKAAGFLL